MAPAFGGINLEDIAAPRCFEIEATAERRAATSRSSTTTSTARPSWCSAGIINALRLVGKDKASVRVVVNGAGSAGIAIAKLLAVLRLRDA